MEEETTELQSSDKVMVVVGRSPDVAHFVHIVNQYLSDNYDLVAAQPLEEEDDRDFQGNLRFIGFVSGAEAEGMTLDNLALVINGTGGTLGATIYEDMVQAMGDAKIRYGFDNGFGAAQERAEKVQELIAKFKPFSADEVEYAHVFMALFETGRLRMIRGLLDDEPVITFCLVTNDEAGTEINCKVMCVLATTKIRSDLELPFIG